MRMVDAFGKVREGVTLEKARADIAIVAATAGEGLSEDLSGRAGIPTVAATPSRRS